MHLPQGKRLESVLMVLAQTRAKGMPRARRSKRAARLCHQNCVANGTRRPQVIPYVLDSIVEVDVERKASNPVKGAAKATTFAQSQSVRVSIAFSNMERSDKYRNPLNTEPGPMYMLNNVSCWRSLQVWRSFVLQARLLAWLIQ